MILKSKFVLSSLVAMLAGAPVLAENGGEGSKGGGGGDVKFEDRLEKTQWFSRYQDANPRKIRFCLEVSDQFGVTADTARTTIQDTFQAWVDYRNARLRRDPMPVADQLEYVGRCSGDEDLAFYFGVMNAAVAKAKPQYRNPHSFAERTFMSQTYWSKGFLWFANPGTIHLPLNQGAKFPDWGRVENQLYAALLHEWGHIFGCRHLPDTIMSEQIYHLLAASSRQGTEWRRKIDHRRELVRSTLPILIDTSAPGDLLVSLSSTIEESTSARNVFRALGVAPSAHQIRFQLWGKESGLSSMGVVIGDSQNSQQEFKLSKLAVSWLGMTGLQFKSPVAVLGSLQFTHSFLFTASIQAQGGEWVTFQLEYNMNGSGKRDAPWALYAIYQGERVFIASFQDFR